MAIFLGGKMLGVFTYQKLRHNAPNHAYATHWRPFGYPSRVYQNPHRGKTDAKLIINTWVRNN